MQEHSLSGELEHIIEIQKREIDEAKKRLSALKTKEGPLSDDELEELSILPNRIERFKEDLAKNEAKRADTAEKDEQMAVTRQDKRRKEDEELRGRGWDGRSPVYIPADGSALRHLTVRDAAPTNAAHAEVPADSSHTAAAPAPADVAHAAHAAHAEAPADPSHAAAPVVELPSPPAPQ